MATTFSVIIPVYNASRYLPACMDSVSRQTFQDFECICVDDGSTDGSGAILDEYAAKDSRFKVIHKTNGGEGSARNAGLAAATGEWVTWLDADDLYAPTRLEAVKRIIDAEYPDMVRTERMDGVEPDQEFIHVGAEAKCQVVDGHLNVQKWGWNNLASGGMVWLWFVRRHLLDGLAFRPELRVMTDAIFSAGLICRLDKICQCDYKGYFYRDAAGSLIRGSRRAGDCVRHLVACCDLWKRAQADARKLGYLNEVLTQMRNAGEGVVVDWATHRDNSKEPSADVREVYEAFKHMEVLGALDGRRTIYRYYGLPLWWWRKTGRIGMIVFLGRVLMALNQLLGRV